LKGRDEKGGEKRKKKKEKKEIKTQQHKASLAAIPSSFFRGKDEYSWLRYKKSQEGGERKEGGDGVKGLLPNFLFGVEGEKKKEMPRTFRHITHVLRRSSIFF